MTQLLEPNQVTPPGDPDGLRVRPILRSDDVQVYSDVRLADCRTTLARGLREYLETFEVQWLHGRLLRFAQVEETWAEPEEVAVYPACSVVGDEPGTYEDAEMAPHTFEIEDAEGKGTGFFLRRASEMNMTFTLLLWATDPDERAGLVALVEDAMEPADFMTGLRLELPYYFNARATYEKLSVAYEDSADAAARRWRKARVRVRGNLAQLVPVGRMPLGDRVRTKGEVKDHGGLVGFLGGVESVLLDER